MTTRTDRPRPFTLASVSVSRRLLAMAYRSDACVAILPHTDRVYAMGDRASLEQATYAGPFEIRTARDVCDGDPPYATGFHATDVI